MEARTAFHRPGASKRMAAVVLAALAALVLGGIGGYVVKTLTLRTLPTAVSAQSAASGFGTAWNYGNRRSGTQSIEGPAPAGLPTSTSFREPTIGRSGPQS